MPTPVQQSSWWHRENHADRRPFLLARGRIKAALRHWFEAQGFVSAGNTGAVMATAKMIQGMSRGVHRPALASAFPTLKGTPVVVVDVGVRPLLARLVSEPGHDHVVELTEDTHRPLRPVGDGLALGGR